MKYIYNNTNFNKYFVLVLNCGSSSLKFSVINTKSGEKYISGIAENILSHDKMCVKWNVKGTSYQTVIDGNNQHSEALFFILNKILVKYPDLLLNLQAIGHRVVHGGNKLTQSVIINDNIIKEIDKASVFAPLHNPAHIIGIKSAFHAFPKLSKKNVAVFDTSFHQTMPEEAFLYALPYYFYEKYGIRKYGAHGISHLFIAREASKFLQKSCDAINIITCHLGNGSSICAIKNGKCVDTSMGFTPLEGLIMGTRCGDIDPAIIFYLHNVIGISIHDIQNILIKKSGMLGITNETYDFKYIENNYMHKSNIKKALVMYCNRLSKYISAYSTLMEGKLDAIVFTGGIGENSDIVRELTINNLSLLNFTIDKIQNKLMRFGKSGVITQDKSAIALVIPTNEELVIAQDTARLIINNIY